MKDIVINEADSDLDIISESVLDDSRDKDFDIKDFTESSTSNSSEEIDDNDISCLKNQCLIGNDASTEAVTFLPLSEKIKVSIPNF